MNNSKRIPLMSLIFLSMLFFITGVGNCYLLESDCSYKDSIVKLMYDTPSARDTVMQWYDRWLMTSSIPYTEKYIQTTLGKTHVLMWGDTSNPPLVILHGGQHNATMWLDIAPYLIKKFCLYAPDIICEPSGKTIATIFPAKRENYTIWLKETMDSLGLKQPFLAGISLGSIISMDFALQMPASIKKLIIISPPGGIVKTRFSTIFKLIWHMLFAGEKASQKIVDAVRSPTVKSSEMLYSYFECLMKHCKQGYPIPWFYKDRELSMFQMPLLLLIGSDEIFIKPKAAFNRARKFIPQIQTVLIKNAGHHSISDQPDEISEMIIRFCK